MNNMPESDKENRIIILGRWIDRLKTTIYPEEYNDIKKDIIKALEKRISAIKNGDA